MSIQSLKNREFSPVYRRGKRSADPCFVLYFLENGTDGNRLGITVSKKVGNSVVRSRVKRIIKEAYRLCPNGIYMHPNFDKYRAESAKLHQIWNDYASASEYIALDEAYLDVTEQAGDWEGARRIARTIQRRTREELGLSLAISDSAAVTLAFPGGFDDFYIVQNETPLSALTLQAEEVQSVRWATREEVIRLLHAGAFAPYWESFLNLLFDLNSHLGLSE